MISPPKFAFLSLSILLLAQSPIMAQSTAATAVTTVSPILKQLEQFKSKSKAKSAALREIKSLYKRTNYNPIWQKNGILSDKARALIAALSNAHEDGLIPAEYLPKELLSAIDGSAAEDMASIEVGLTMAIVSYGKHLNAGRVKPSSVNREIIVYPKAVSAEAILSAAIQSTDIATTLQTLAPSTVRYARMRKHLASLRQIAAAGGWESLPKSAVLKPGMESEIVPALARRLVQAKDLASADSTGNTYNDTLVEAVKRFQRRLGLEDDGIVGPGTFGVLNITAEQRIREVELNMERRRWMQNDYGPYYVFVNLADQVLKLVKNEKTIHTALVQVGKPFHRTPVFTDTMEYMELNPYWNVPYSIATKEYLPKLRRNPGVLARQNIEVLAGGKAVSAYAINWSQYSRGRFPFRLRQKPGKRNALGRIKFMFPNKYNIYIHDTPSKSNFNRASRYFSHGCVRVKDPLKLAEVILATEGWSRGKIDRIIRSGKRTVKRLKSKIPVHIAYLTAWVNKDGSIHYRKDIYGRDKILDKALKRVTGG